MTASAYDVLIIGSGQAAGPLATALTSAGRRVALVEAVHVGGTCINEGCTPTKTMVASARVAYLARRAADYGVRFGPVDTDMAVVRQRKRDVVTSFRDGSTQAILDGGVDLIRGTATFTAADRVSVRATDGAEQDLTAPVIVLNTGARPARPPIPGLDSVAALDSTSIMELDEVPDHLVVLGGGYVGIEFGQMFRRFGSRVTIVQRASRLLAREDADVADAVAAVLRDDGIDILLDTGVVAVNGDAGQVTVTVRSPSGAEHTHSGSHLLVATGRVPNTEHLGLDAAGVASDARGYVTVDERLRTNVAGIYAVGDVKPGPAFTHISYDDFRVLRTNLAEGGDATITNRLVPYCVFMDPQLASVGLHEEEARAQGRRVRVARLGMDHVARAIEVAETRGFMKAIVDADTDRILGFTVLGIEGGEMMAAMEIAMLGNLPYTALRDGIFAHPTLMEAFNNLFSSLPPAEA
jgi:pyruvate/2-oxoglutarate dehydrogenase complex dihydrolipoamide dehydrogenase (E3) component